MQNVGRKISLADDIIPQLASFAQLVKLKYIHSRNRQIRGLKNVIDNYLPPFSHKIRPWYPQVSYDFKSCKKKGRKVQDLTGFKPVLPRYCAADNLASKATR